MTGDKTIFLVQLFKLYKNLDYGKPEALYGETLSVGYFAMAKNKTDISKFETSYWEIKPGQKLYYVLGENDCGIEHEVYYFPHKHYDGEIYNSLSYEDVLKLSDVSEASQSFPLCVLDFSDIRRISKGILTHEDLKKVAEKKLDDVSPQR